MILINLEIPKSNEKKNHYFQMAERSFRFYRNVGREDVMPEKIAKEWDELRKRVEETTQTERKLKNSFEIKDLCEFQ